MTNRISGKIEVFKFEFKFGCLFELIAGGVLSVTTKPPTILNIKYKFLCVLYWTNRLKTAFSLEHKAFMVGVLLRN